MLLHVVDISDPGWRRQLEVTHEVLEEIGAADIPRMNVFNKVDRLTGEAQVQMIQQVATLWPDGVIMSAKDPHDVRHLHEAITKHFHKFLVEDELRVPYGAQHLRGPLFESCEVLSETYEQDVVVFRVRGPAHTIAALAAQARDAIS